MSQKWLECGHGTLKSPVTGKTFTTHVVELEGFGRIFEVYHYGNEPEKSQLLIEAAPELLTALQEIVRAKDVGMGKSAVELRIDLARAAIAKALGEQK